jgi:type VII secretion protein EccB
VQSRRDHLQAYQFSVGRLARSAAAGDATTGEAPGRRANMGSTIGIVLGVLLCGGAVVFGLISPKPTDSWRASNAIVVDANTGSRFLYVDGMLRPVANYASALLAVGQQASVQMVAGSRLTGVPIGAPIGIPGAPDELPTAAELLPGSWALCLEPNGAVAVDLAPTGRTIPAQNAAILVAPPASAGTAAPQSEYVLWGATKYPVTNRAVLPALGLGNRDPIPASSAWLATLPTGPALVPAQVPGAGGPGPLIAGLPRTIGQVFQTVGNGVEQYYVLRADGLAPITATEAALLGSVPDSAPAVDLTSSELAAAPFSTDRSLLGRLPALLSNAPYSQTNTSLCILQHSPGNAATTQLVTENPAALSGAHPALVPPDRGVLAELPGPQPLTGAAIYLITDTGEKFLIDSTNALDSLGYAGVQIQAVPAQVLAMIPSGPVLDIAAAEQDTA